MKLSSLLKALPAPVKDRLRTLRDALELAVVRGFSRNGFLASLYYCLFSRQFYREHRAVLLGRLHFMEAMKRPGGNPAFLRRNVHRLEKGLIMRPRRPVFAEDYVGETVRAFVAAMPRGAARAGHHRWASDVLGDYFAAVGNSPRIDQARRHYQACAPTVEAADDRDRCVPYPHRDLPPCPVDYAQLLVLLKRRRSVRWYLDKPVDEALVRQAVEAATLAPSACNRQPFRFHVTLDPARAPDIAACALGTAGFAGNLPCLIAVVGDLGAYPAERDRHVIYIDGALAAMQLMLAFETLGLSTCPINWPDLERQERLLADKLGLAYHERPILLLAVGHPDPDGGIPYSQKKTADELLVVDGGATR